MIILKILAIYTAISSIAAAILCFLITWEKRRQPNHLPPLPSGSILHKRPERELSR
jgi:hypothetical protein